MKLATVALAIGMACFTEPNGTLSVWIVPSQVVAVSHARACDPRAKSKISTLQGEFCVQEPPDQVRKRLESAQ